MATEERDWLVRAQAGDATAFGRVVAAHQTAVFNVAYRMLGNRRDAEDATQEAFLRAFDALDRFDVERPFRPWIKQIVTNVCLNVLQSARSQRQFLATEMTRPGSDAVKMDDWQSKRPLPEQEVAAQLTAEQVRAAILQLPPSYRAVIELRHFQDLSYAEMAEILDKPLSTIKSDLFRARKMLGRLLIR